MGEGLSHTPEGVQEWKASKEEELNDERHTEIAEAIKGGARFNDKNELAYTQEQIERIREDNKEQMRTLEDLQQEVSSLNDEIQRLIGFRERLSKSIDDDIMNKGVFYKGSTEHWEDEMVLKDIKRSIKVLGDRSYVLEPILYEKAGITRK
ncbi:hypothetical protein COX10_02020 [Candidatus Berkelbacteria bacterium CG23_combo_of_CG06-09_8_20_14_all_33_15]|nr:MAG: hypothetical protein COX10_02020 [Candidatus Berkelbacteria bacterium CG23_combo_of_CG06-09_8_20_14_all_33_15]